MHERVLPGLLAVLILACGDPTAPVAVGDWGGTEASLSLSASGGTISYQCGAGTIAPGWTLTADGRFSASGQHFFGGGPVPPGGRPPHPAVYDGQVSGPYLTLTVTVTDQALTLGPYLLARGGAEVAEVCA